MFLLESAVAFINLCTEKRRKSKKLQLNL